VPAFDVTAIIDQRWGNVAMPMFADSTRGLAAALTITALIIAALVLGRDVLMPFALATILAFMLAPVVGLLTRYRVPRSASVGFVIVLLVGIFFAASALFSSQLLSLTASLSGYRDNLTQKVRLIAGAGKADGVIGRAAESIELLEKALTKETTTATPGPSTSPIIVSREAQSGVGTFMAQLRAALGPLTAAGLTLLFAGFLLVQYHDLRDRVVRLAGTDNMATTTSALSEAGGRLSRLFLLQAALNGGFGIFVAIALAVIGVPNAALWGVATFFLRFIPFIGSFLAAIPPILLAAAVDPGWGMALATLALFAIGEPILGHVIEPTVLGTGVGLSPFAMVAAASFWSLVWGPIGLILAAPLTMTIVVLGRYIPRIEFMSVLLGDAPALAPAQEFYHRILADDAAAAATQLETEVEAGSIGSATDMVVLPALRLAARDHRLDRVDKTRTDALRDTMATVVDVIRDGLSLAEVNAKPNATSRTADASPDVIVIPARGPVDLIASEFVAAMLEATSGIKCIAIKQASGLMAVSAARTMSTGSQLKFVIISTVGGMDHEHLRLLQRRASTDFPRVRLIVCDWGTTVTTTPADNRALGNSISSIAKFADVLTLLAYPAADENDHASTKIITAMPAAIQREERPLTAVGTA
jgi:predicted PurR-regulated permease PerM